MKYVCLILVGTPLLLAAQLFDASTFDLRKHKQVLVSGPWQFYWDTLFIPNAKTQLPHKQVNAPHYWRPDNPGAFGKATYYAQVKLGTQAQPHALYIPYIRCAAAVYINGSIATKMGIPDDPEKYQSKLGSLFTALPDSGIVDVVIQVANYENRYAGLAATPRLGHPQLLYDEIKLKTGLDMVFVGCLLAMGIYLITMYFLYREGYAFLFLALICVAVFLRTMTTESSSLLLPAFFPDSGWGIWKKIEFISVYSVVALLPLYISHMFRAESNRKIDSFFIGLAVLLCLVVVFTQHSIFSSILDVAHIGLLLGFIYAVFVVRKAQIRKNPDARVLLIGILSAFPFIFLEILKNSAWQINIPFTHLVELGVLTFLFFQVFVLANHYATTYRNLSIEVEKRTVQLSKTNAVNSRMLAILSHDIRGPLNSLKGIMQLFNQGQLGEGEIKQMTQLIEAQTDRTSLLVENILMWVKSQSTGITLKQEFFDLHELIMSNISIYKMQANLQDMSLQAEVRAGQKVFADEQVVSLILRNLIANAIRYSNVKSTITIRARDNSDSIVLQVINPGKGMTSDQVAQIFQPSTSLQSQESTGLGLKLCRAYLLAMKTDFEIVSIPDGETIISVVLKNKE